METCYITYLNLFLSILCGGIRDSTGARLHGDLKKRSLSSIPHQEELEKVVTEKLPQLSAVLSAQYEDHCLKRGIRVKSGEIEKELEMCVEDPIRRFITNTLAGIQSAPPDVLEDTTNAGMKIYFRTLEDNFQELSPDELNALQKQVVGPFCGIAVEILQCFQTEIGKGKLKCANWYEKKILEYITYHLGSLCFNNGSRIIQFLNVDMSKSKCIKGNLNFDYHSCYTRRGMDNKEPETLPELCRTIEVLGECGKEHLTGCNEKNIMDIANPMIRESQTWAKTSCLQENYASSAERIQEFRNINGFLTTTLYVLLNFYLK